MSAFFLPYEGRQPYLFVSYAHASSALVIPAISRLHTLRWRLWYDEGIPPGADWSVNIVRHLRRCAAVLFFISRESLRSDNCFNEISAAMAQRKPLITVALDDTPLPARWVPLLEGAARVLPREADPDAVLQSILQSGSLDEALMRREGEEDDTQAVGNVHRRRFRLAAIALSLLLLCSAGWLAGVYTGRFPPPFSAEVSAAPPTQVPTQTSSQAPTAEPAKATPLPTIDPGKIPPYLLEEAEFDSEQLERAVRDALDQPDAKVFKWQLQSIRELLFCGNMTLQDDLGIRFLGEEQCRVNGAPVVRGQLNDLDLFTLMPFLSKLSLVYQQVRDISKLNSHAYLSELALQLNPLEKLGDMSAMQSLTILHLEHTPLRDLSALHALGQLKTVTVSADMFPLTIGSDSPRFDLVLVP